MSKYFDLLTKKSKSQKESDWAIILERVPSDFSKQNVIKLISEVFPLSSDDSKDLVESTPIVLLDQLPFEMAEQIRRYFENRDVGCMATKDPVVKRKCYRAVWPTTPNLVTIINNVTHKDKDAEGIQAEETPETGHLPFVEMMKPSEKVEKTAEFVVQSENIPADSEEKKQLRQLTLDLQKENEALRGELDRVKVSVRDDQQRQTSEQTRKIQADKQKFDESIRQLRKEKAILTVQNQDLQQKTDQLEHQLKKSAELASDAAKSSDYQNQIEKVQAEMQAERKRLTEMINALQTECDQHKQNMSRLSTDKQFLVAENESLTFKLKEVENEKIKKSQFSDEEFQNLKTESEQYKQKYLQAAEELRSSQNEAKLIRSENSQAQRVLSESRLEMEELKRIIEQAQAGSAKLEQEADDFREKMENRLQDKNIELEEWKRKANEWSVNHAAFLRETEQMRRQLTEEHESLRVRNQQLTNQLEQLQRQNRDFVSQLEQQELVQKRMKIAAEIAEKEIRLREVTQKQRQIEDDVKLQESTLKEIVSEQSLLENDMIKLKQNQKYMIEQAKKKEKGRLNNNKIKISDPTSLNGDMDDPELTSGDELRDLDRGL